jgi:hypothetical protein
MRSGLNFQLVLLFVLSFGNVQSQMLEVGKQWMPPDLPGEMEAYEKQDDPYLPNAFNNTKLSPAYRDNGQWHSRTGNTQIFTRQGNVSPSQHNILGDAANETSIGVNPLNENAIKIFMI